MNSADEQVERAELANNWDRDQVVLNQIRADLEARFGPTPNAAASEYLAALQAALVTHDPNLYRVTVRVMGRLITDVEDMLKDVYKAKWMQAAHFVASYIAYTSFAFIQ